MARRKRERREKVIVITGEQQPDIDARAIARVLIRLARQWADGQQNDDTPSAAPSDRADQRKDAS